MTKPYLDTYIFMDILSGRLELVEKARKYLKELEGDRKAVISAIILSELGFHVARRRGHSRAEEVLFYVQTLPNIEIVPVTQEIASLAGRLRSKYHKKIEKKLTYFDCIHLATAIQAGCTKFVTGDKGFKDIKEIEVEIY